ncbi:hypothetical protein MOV66_10240 [Agrobacterium sp. SHOUNA12C]|nr:hypothetical protein [Agrobacterium sp. BETTINA12B]MCJ9757022.1 hypothetical protein [Agrobacterium sp. SHOUNA12C]
MLKFVYSIALCMITTQAALAQDNQTWQTMNLKMNVPGNWEILSDTGFAYEANIPTYLEDRLQALVPQFKAVGDGVATPAGTGIPFNFAANVRATAVPGSVQFADTKEAAIPDSVKKSVYLFRNCTGENQGIKDKITTKYKIGRVTRITDSVKSKTSVGFGIPIQGVNLTLSSDVNVDFSKDTTVDESKEETVERPIEVSVPSYTARLFILETRLGNGFIDFSGRVLADADVVWRRNNSPNGEIVRKIDDLSHVVRPEFRTFDLKGQIWNVTTVANNLTYIDKKLDASKISDCPQFNLDTGQVLKATSLEVNSGTQVVVPLVDGMTIQTADVTANVEVRARSYGPGFCAVKASAGSQEIGIAAPPEVWSDWFVVASHLGRATFSLSSEVICDTGAQFEVRYYR